MKTLEVTDDQYAIVQQLRDEIGDHVVGKYGHVRERDAVQFLIDNLHDELELEPGTASEDVEIGEDAVLEDDSDLQTVSYDESESVDDESETVEEDDDGDSAPEPEPTVEESSETGLAGTPGAPTDDGEETTGDDGGADDDEMLDEMLNLLETHDGKWTESSAADFRYTVTLPDGSTESVQTKDDVRALLFKHYR
ncbi:hypothetical protein [Natronococcus occultus]|uniref:Uncharacterized protein n=1 Tax=Natronococcus occultus SP4 TaxID=694430 RepID=L0JZA3_9EURY|nr:hypothetical protein [Natronococcus occultus]AGB37424.1 hypothetical protein Natoc_1619 [Natronococcus occultus SP4]